MSVFDLLTESVTSRARSGNPLELLPARQWAVVTLLGAGMKATAIAKLLHITRETLYQDRRRAWQALRPVIPGRILREYEGSVAPWKGRSPAPPADDVIAEAVI